ncbi:MAG: hypothetical protein STSR0009_03500 [Methanoregula sp.]
MRFGYFLTAVLAVVFVLACLPPASAAEPIGGNQGWYAVHCNVDGAQVYFDGTYKGDIVGGVLTVPVYSTGTPYKTYTVSKTGYTTYTAPVVGVPGIGETINLYATLNLVAPTTAAVIGGNQGWYVVHCNVNGATVMFDNTVEGVITQGTLTVPVYTTGTPFQTYTVSMNGYIPYTSTITNFPGNGQSVDLYATLNPAPTTPVTPAPTKSPVPVILVFTGLGIVGLACMRKGRL